MRKTFASGRPGLLAFLPRFLFAARDPVPFYVLKAFPLSLLPALAIALVATAIAPEARLPELETEGWSAFVLLALVAPVIETILMALLLMLLLLFLRPGAAAAASALAWAMLHSLSAPIWGFSAGWSFLIFSVSFLAWKERGLFLALLVPAAIHALQNTLAGALIWAMAPPAT
ncbi:MAG: hypothetical protein ACFBQW_02980 [Sphingomonadaceae bacterium]